MKVRPRLRPDLEGVVLDGELVLHDPVAAKVHHLNAPATLVASLLDGERSMDVVVEHLRELVPGTSRGLLEQDVAALLEGLDAASLLEDADVDPR